MSGCKTGGGLTLLAGLATDTTSRIAKVPSIAFTGRMGHAEYRVTLTISTRKRREKMAIKHNRPPIDPQLYDAGMFPDYPDLRMRYRQRKPAAVCPPAPYRYRMIEQTGLVKFMEMLLNDSGLSEGLDPLPMDIDTFQKSYSDSEAVQLEDGTWMKPETISAAWYEESNTESLLPEITTEGRAGREGRVASLMASAKTREVTQWWLCCDAGLAKTVESLQLVTVCSADEESVWVASYDETPCNDFWETSIGFCLGGILNERRKFI